MQIDIVSGGNPPRFQSHLNHAVYAEIWGHRYHWDCFPREDLQTKHFHKLRAVLDALDVAGEWGLWMDDDAFFTDFSADITEFIKAAPEQTLFIGCRSPINSRGGWTVINSGLFFVRNCETTRRLLTAAFEIPNAIVEEKWQEDIYGMRVYGEQSHIIHVLFSSLTRDRFRILDWDQFNARPYHWRGSKVAERYPVVHFAGVGEKIQAIRDFSNILGRDTSLVPQKLSRVHGRRAQAAARRSAWSHSRRGGDTRPEVLRRIGDMLAGSKSVIDIGCGRQGLAHALPPGIAYLPADLQASAPGIEICDLNLGIYPKKSLAVADAGCLLNVIPYLEDPVTILKDLGSHLPRIIVSYERRLQDAFPLRLNMYRLAELGRLLRRAGWEVVALLRIGQTVILDCRTGTSV